MSNKNAKNNSNKSANENNDWLYVNKADNKQENKNYTGTSQNKNSNKNSNNCK